MLRCCTVAVGIIITFCGIRLGAAWKWYEYFNHLMDFGIFIEGEEPERVYEQKDGKYVVRKEATKVPKMTEHFTEYFWEMLWNVPHLSKIQRFTQDYTLLFDWEGRTESPIIQQIRECEAATSLRGTIYYVKDFLPDVNKNDRWYGYQATFYEDIEPEVERLEDSFDDDQ